MSEQGYRLSKDIADQVVADGVAREADDLNGSGTRHMLFRNAHGIAQSCLVEDWPAVAADLAAAEQARQKRAQAKAALRQALAPIAGKRAGQWSVAEMRDLLAVVLDVLGLLDDDQGSTTIRRCGCRENRPSSSRGSSAQGHRNAPDLAGDPGRCALAGQPWPVLPSAGSQVPPDRILSESL
jgi:hypothetical protein